MAFDMAIKLAAIDLDGTTLDDRAKLSYENKEAIERVAASGVHVVLSTGRTNAELPKELLQIPVLRYGILANGAKIVDLQDRNVLHSDFLNRDMAEQAIAFTMKYRCMCELYTDGKVYVKSKCLQNVERYGVTLRLKKLVEETRTGVDDLMAFFHSRGGKVEKLNIFFGDPEHRRQFLKDTEIFSGMVEITGSMETNAEVNSKTATKGSGLEHLSRLLGIKREEVMAIGDSGNDISMLNFAGLAVAVANADEAVKAIAGEIVPANTENGLKAAFDRFILKR